MLDFVRLSDVELRLVFVFPRLACIDGLDFWIVVHALQFAHKRGALKVLQPATQTRTCRVRGHHVVAGLAAQRLAVF